MCSHRTVRFVKPRPERSHCTWKTENKTSRLHFSLCTFHLQGPLCHFYIIFLHPSVGMCPQNGSVQALIPSLSHPHWPTHSPSPWSVSDVLFAPSCRCRGLKTALTVGNRLVALLHLCQSLTTGNWNVWQLIGAVNRGMIAPRSPLHDARRSWNSAWL